MLVQQTFDRTNKGQENSSITIIYCTLNTIENVELKFKIFPTLLLNSLISNIPFFNLILIM